MENKTSLEAQNEEPRPLTKWTVDLKKCTGCAECVYACTRQLLVIKDKTLIMTDEQRCDECGDCISVCAYRAIKFI